MSVIDPPIPPETTPSTPQRRVDSTQAALDLFAPLRHETTEIAAFAYLDPDWRLLGVRHRQQGLDASVQLALRDIAADAIGFGAAAIVVAHNHPSGDASPSLADRDATRRIARALAALDVQLVDHLIIAADRHYSFRDARML